MKFITMTAFAMLALSNIAEASTYCAVYNVVKGLPRDGAKGTFDGKMPLVLQTWDKAHMAKIRLVPELNGAMELQLQSGKNLTAATFDPQQKEKRLVAFIDGKQFEVLCTEQ